MRGLFAWRTHDWATALDLTLAQLNDSTHRDLQPEAAMRLASIFAELANPDNRADLLNLLRSRPPAIARLQQFLSKADLYRTHPLRYLGDFLGDQLGFKPAYEQGPS